MMDALVVFHENARKARDLDAEVKETKQRELDRLEAEQAREALLETERKAIVEHEREAERDRVATLENFQNDIERVLGAAASGNFSNRMSDTLGCLEKRLKALSPKLR